MSVAPVLLALDVAPVLLALDVASSLTASGADATTRVTPDGRVELLVLLDPWSRTMGVLDVGDLITALVVVLVPPPDGSSRA